jgi:hypothetical protein
MAARPGFRESLGRALTTERLRVVDRPQRDPVLAVLGRMVGRAFALAERARTATLSLAGFGCVTAGVWVTWGRGAGLATAGASLLILEFLSRPDPSRR